MITSIHEGFQVIAGSARHLVCRTRGPEATILNRRLRTGADGMNPFDLHRGKDAPRGTLGSNGMKRGQ